MCHFSSSLSRKTYILFSRTSSSCLNQSGLRVALHEEADEEEEEEQRQLQRVVEFTVCTLSLSLLPHRVIRKSTSPLLSLSIRITGEKPTSCQHHAIMSHQQTKCTNQRQATCFCVRQSLTLKTFLLQELFKGLSMNRFKEQSLLDTVQCKKCISERGGLRNFIHQLYLIFMFFMHKIYTVLNGASANVQQQCFG